MIFCSSLVTQPVVIVQSLSLLQAMVITTSLVSHGIIRAGALRGADRCSATRAPTPVAKSEPGAPRLLAPSAASGLAGVSTLESRLLACSAKSGSGSLCVSLCLCKVSVSPYASSLYVCLKIVERRLCRSTQSQDRVRGSIRQ